MVFEILNKIKDDDDRRDMLDLIQSIGQAISHLDRSIDLQEKTKSAFKSKLIAESRNESEKAREILRKMTYKVIF